MAERQRISRAELREACNADEKRRPVSFVVPAYQATSTLRASIASIRGAAPTDSEVIIIDDGSLDGTADLADELGDIVVRRPCQGGAARSRNDGASVASGVALVFVDSDVTVSSDAVAGILRHLDDGWDAAFGAYEAMPPPGVRNAASIYKNLLHHHTHLRAAGPASTFWSGFGAVRRDAFFAVGGFDPANSTGADVEDIHLGYRLRAAGFRILLDPSLQVRHHKRYTVKGVILSDILHRAVPWTRAMLEHRTFKTDLNLRRGSIVAAGVTFAVPVALAAVPWAGRLAWWSAALSMVAWIRLQRDFLTYVRRTWGPAGALYSTAMLYVYSVYSVAGVAIGFFAYLLRHERRSTLNSWQLEPSIDRHSDIAVTLAVIASRQEPLLVLESLPLVEPWWELLVVGAVPPDELPPNARFLRVPDHFSRNQMREMALRSSQGEMFATLNAACVPDPGWLDRVRQAAATNVLAVGGSFRHDQRSVSHRAEQVVRFWRWRPERAPHWMVDHPVSNTAFRANVARSLGGFQVEGALFLRLAGFGARPIRFEPGMAVELKGASTMWDFGRGVAGVARLRAAAATRYHDIGVVHRVLLVTMSPLSGLVDVVRTLSTAVREGTADRSFWRAVPLITAGLAGHWLGRDLGLMRPRYRGGLIPRSISDLETLDWEAPDGEFGPAEPPLVDHRARTK